ncbi:MAG TPA: 3-oxoacyl-ACP reductase FabG [Clostridiales bacterium]|jgi:3-oxoacyl-[acyl-carrier protein] reductase|nr:3-oxoacyl-ACP reductase FabG [Clostridiales bacterium]
MKRVLITGGSRGIGAGCVIKFAAMGCRVAFVYMESKTEAAFLAQKTGAMPIRADISDPEAALGAVTQAADALGGLDVLVNNAGVARSGLFTELSDQDWDVLCGTNLSGTIYVTRAAARHMISQHYGRIINIGSVWGRVGGSCEVAYSATKSALRGFTRALAKELGPSGITVNCVEPGVIDTDMNAELPASACRSLVEETPLGRLGTPADVAAAVFFLASDDAAFITGQIIGVDGGFGV